MSKDAPIPCIVCGTRLRNVMDDSDNQPSEGTEFRSYGHYGSTFWDSFGGEEIVINVCDECLRKHAAERIMRQKRFRKIVVFETTGTFKGRARTIVGRQWVSREMVEWFPGHEDEDDEIGIEVREIGIIDLPGEGHYDRIEWVSNWREIKANLAASQRAEDGVEGGCKHERFRAECTDCGATPLQGLR